MKNLISLILLAGLSCCANAGTWYIRAGGGTTPPPVTVPPVTLPQSITINLPSLTCTLSGTQYVCAVK